MTDELTEFFDQGLSGFVITDTDGKITRVNTAFSGWLGLAPVDVTGRRLSEFLSISGKIYLETHLMPLLHVIGFFDEVALELTAQDGSRIPVLINGRARADQPGITSFIISKFSERLRYEKDILSARDELQSANANLLTRMRSEVSERLTAEGMYSSERATAILRERFIAALGHDLRNPLAAMTGGLGLLSRRDLDPKAATYVSLMTDSVNRMTSMVADLMDFARGRMGADIIFHRDPELMGPWITLAAQELQTANPERQIELKVNVTETIDCDPIRITQLLSNLIGNAITHGDPDGTVTVTADLIDKQLVLSVVNTGNTIPPDVIDQLFEPFVRLDKGPNNAGLGLGLYISDVIARGHDGTLTVVSANRTTTFTLILPQRIPA